MIIKNIQLHSNQTISNDSLVMYFDGRMAQINNPFTHEDFQGNETDVTINLTFLLDSINKYQTKTAFLFYATNSTIWNSTEQGVYAELTSADTIYYLVSSWEESNRADVLFNISMNQNEKKDIYMRYDINKNSGEYCNISQDSVNNSMMNITIEENSLKKGTSPIFTKEPVTESYASTKIFLAKDGLFKMTLMTWY